MEEEKSDDHGQDDEKEEEDHVLASEENDTLAKVIIIPSIVTTDTEKDDIQVEEILEEKETEEERHQHYFCDQVALNRAKWPENRWWFNTAAMIAVAVDLSNIASFPNHVSNNGGLAYIIAYICVVILTTYPMVYLELLVGQYFQIGMLGIWGICPIARALGAGYFYFTCMVVAVLPSSIMWSCIMMFEAISSIPSGHRPGWVSCTNDWNTCSCAGNRNRQCMELKKTSNDTTIITRLYTPAFEFYVGKVLKMWKTKYADNSIISDVTENGNWTTAYGFNNEKDGIGPLIGQSCIVVVAIFVIIVCLSGLNLKDLGHYYTVICNENDDNTFSVGFSILALGLLFCRAITLEGASVGLLKYFKTDLRKLGDMSVWYQAFESAFFSMGTGMGCHIALASLNPLYHNCRRDAIVCIVVDTVTSLMGSVVVFMYVGHLYYVKQYPLPEKFPGETFIFVILPECLSVVSGSFFAFLMYFIIVVLMLDTQVVALQILSAALYEDYKRRFPGITVHRLHFSIGIASFGLTLALFSSTRGGIWMYLFLYEYSLAQSLFVFMLLESVIFSWIWGLDEVCKANIVVLGGRPNLYLRVCWKYILPLLMMGSLIHTNTSSNQVRPIGVFGQVSSMTTARIGYCLRWIPPLVILVYAIYYCCKTKTKNISCLQAFLLVISPEYEHQQILADVKNSKRLHWRHYSFLQYDDEKFNTHICEFFRRHIKIQPVAAEPEADENREIQPSEKRTKKKRSTKTIRFHGSTNAEDEQQISAWELLDERKKDRSGASASSNKHSLPQKSSLHMLMDFSDDIQEEETLRFVNGTVKPKRKRASGKKKGKKSTSTKL